MEEDDLKKEVMPILRRYSRDLSDNAEALSHIQIAGAMGEMLAEILEEIEDADAMVD